MPPDYSVRLTPAPNRAETAAKWLYSGGPARWSSPLAAAVARGRRPGGRPGRRVGPGHEHRAGRGGRAGKRGAARDRSLAGDRAGRRRPRSCSSAAIDAYDALELRRGAGDALDQAARARRPHRRGRADASAALRPVPLPRPGRSAAGRARPRAWDELVTSVVIDPTRELDPARFPPTRSRASSSARNEARAAGRAAVKLAVDAPAGCSVAVDAHADERGRRRSCSSARTGSA